MLTRPSTPAIPTVLRRYSNRHASKRARSRSPSLSFSDSDTETKHTTTVIKSETTYYSDGTFAKTNSVTSHLPDRDHKVVFKRLEHKCITTTEGTDIYERNISAYGPGANDIPDPLGYVEVNYENGSVGAKVVIVGKSETKICSPTAGRAVMPVSLPAIEGSSSSDLATPPTVKTEHD